MNINKSGFYKLSEINSKKIIVNSGVIAIFFDDCSLFPLNLSEIIQNRVITLEENSKVEVYGVLQNISDYKLNVISPSDGSTLKIRYLLLAGESEITKAKIKSSIESSYTNSDLKILSIVQNAGEVEIDGVIDIKKNIEKVDAHLLEENLFLGNTGKLRGVPSLYVSSDDVKASHACRIERISDEKLFYLRSRALKKENALSMMIEAKIVHLFSCLSMVDNDFYNNLIKNILEKIK